jgi:SAM-dependent methyltransferase
VKDWLLELLACPECRAELAREGERLACRGGHAFPIVGEIPRFVPAKNYAASFGFQWNEFARAQLDEELGLGASAERFWSETRWPRSLSGEVVLEAGCGAGRFTAHAASSGARVVAVDFSNAVEAAWRNNPLENVAFLQADLRKIPLKTASVDKVFCFGVLQHTPDPRASFGALLDPLRPGGEVVFDIYRLWWRSLFAGKYFLRPFTKRLRPERLLRLVRVYLRLADPILRLGHLLLGRRGWVVGSLLGIADYRGILPLPPDRLRELSLLDTFDMLSPAYDRPRTVGAVRRWLADAGLESSEVGLGRNGVLARGRRPGARPDSAVPR